MKNQPKLHWKFYQICALAQRAYLALHSTLFGPVVQLIKSLLIGSRCIHNGTHTNHC